MMTGQEDKGGRARHSLLSRVCGSVDGFLFHCETNALLRRPTPLKRARQTFAEAGSEKRKNLARDLGIRSR